MSISPVQKYEIRGQVCPVKSAYLLINIGTNNTVVAAVTGKRIRVMGFIVNGNAGITNFTFKDGNGASLYSGFGPNAAAPTANPFQIPIADCGYFETSTGNALTIDVGVAQIIGNVNYIEYTP